MTDEQPDSVESFFSGGSRGTCGNCGWRTRKMGSEDKAIAALGDHRRDKHSEQA